MHIIMVDSLVYNLEGLDNLDGCSLVYSGMVEHCGRAWSFAGMEEGCSLVDNLEVCSMVHKVVVVMWQRPFSSLGSFSLLVSPLSSFVSFNLWQGKGFIV